tara:strand:- start:948 stop:2912 length:1965 start_codon:yes stop_codon:yes gene_type:complete
LTRFDQPGFLRQAGIPLEDRFADNREAASEEHREEDIMDSEGPFLSAESIHSILEVMPSMGYAYEDIPAFLDNVIRFLKNQFQCQRTSLILSRAYGGILAGDSLSAAEIHSRKARQRNTPPSHNVSNESRDANSVPLPFRDLLENHTPSSERTLALKEICLEINSRFAHRIDNSARESKTSLPRADLAEQDDEIQSYVRALDQMGFEFIYPILLQRDLVGLILLGHSSRPFESRDTLFVEMGSALLALTLRNAAIRRENSRLRLNQVRPVSPPERTEGPPDSSSKSVEETRTTQGNADTRREIQVGNRTIIVSDGLWHYSLETWSRLATVDVPILISGETGTGKELFARWIHQESGSSGPFVPINCASVPDTLWESELFGHVRGAFTDARERRKGLVEMATDGILFFDEIGDMPLDMQGKLLRLIQEKQFRPLGASEERPARCRFLFATHRDLSSMVAAGSFRQDLFYRISTLNERIPPLRERSGDIQALLEYYLDVNSKKYRIQPLILDSTLKDAAIQYSWPGNVRELESLALRLSLEYPGQSPGLKQFYQALDPSYLSQTDSRSPIAPDAARSEDDSLQSQNWKVQEKALSDLGLASGISLDFDHLVQNYSKQILQEALERSEGNRTRAAQHLGISRGRFNYQWKLLFGDNQ